ncbi:MAG: hypothetical protein U0904_05670 [Candidatus Nanopelagicales bacterium]|nr:hypothetical protein [Candidatus Nanopelagicales bacterium]
MTAQPVGDRPPSPPKVKKSLSLDEDLVREFSYGELAPIVNAVLRAEKQRRDRRSDLGALLERLAAERGPTDPDEVARFEMFLR